MLACGGQSGEETLEPPTLSYEYNRINNSIIFQRLDAARSGTKSLERRKPQVMGP
jgi:hypothetical protein